MERIGRYEIIRELGRGAMGAVFQARDPQIDRIVAIKVILTETVSRAELDNFKLRFHREARAAGKMSHGGIVTIHDIAEDQGGRPYLVMEFIEGRTLERLMEDHAAKGQPVLTAQALDIGMQVAEALDYAHRRGVVHRDIKPANILLTEDGVAKIADFGIAKMEGTQLTQTGHMLGTPAFMSPEQFSGGAIDARSDLFSLGAILYWMLTGVKPFEAATLSEVTYKIVFGMPPEPRALNPSLPEGIDTVLERCLAKKAELRYGTCKELAEDLDAVMTGHAIKATPLPMADKTVVVPAGLPPLPAGAPAGGTVAQATPQGTVAQPAAGQRTQASPVAVTAVPAATGFFARMKSRPLLWAGLAAVLLLAGWAGSQMLGGEGEPQRRASVSELPRDAPKQAAPREQAAEPVSTPAPPPADPESTESPASAKGKSKGRSSSRTTASGPRATLRIECLHNFRDATLEITSDGRTLLSARLRGQEQGFGGVAIVSGTYRGSVPVPAGERDFRVRVHSRRSAYDEYDLIGGRFAEGASRTMVIEFGKGSGLGVFDRKLTLRWK